MSVCSQMGNGHGKAEKKKKKDLLKEGTGLVDDQPPEQSELENGDLQQKGSELFQQDWSRRRVIVKDLARQCGTTSHDSDNGELNVDCQGDGGNGDVQQKGPELFHQEQSRRRDVAKDLAKQHGTTSHDCNNGELNADCPGDAENAGNINQVSPNEAIQGNVKCTLRNGEDSVGAFGDSSLMSDCVTGNKSDKVCGDHVTGEQNKTTADPEVVKSGMSTGDATGNAIGNVPGEVLGAVPIDNSRNTPVDVHTNVSDDIPGAVLVNVPSNVSDNVETPGNISGVCVQSGVVPKHALCPSQTVPGMVSIQKKTPTTGDDITSEPDETRAEHFSSNKSIPPTLPSKIESGTPTPMQMVSGVDYTKSTKDDDTENLKGRNNRGFYVKCKIQ